MNREYTNEELKNMPIGDLLKKIDKDDEEIEEMLREDDK